MEKYCVYLNLFRVHRIKIRRNCSIFKLEKLLSNKQLFFTIYVLLFHCFEHLSKSNEHTKKGWLWGFTVVRLFFFKKMCACVPWSRPQWHLQYECILLFVIHINTTAIYFVAFTLDRLHSLTNVHLIYLRPLKIYMIFFLYL